MTDLKTLAYRKSAPQKSGISAPHLSAESEFTVALRRERRRAERSEKPFLLMLAELGTLSANENGEQYLADLASDLASISRETDIIGWHRQNIVLGAIFTELGTNDRGTILAAVQQKVSAVLNGKIGQDVRDINLSFHFFPEDSTGEKHLTLQRYANLYEEPHPKPVALGLKRIIDVAGSALALIVLSPVLLAISILIKLTSRGPLLFRQTRVGRHGKEFTFLKFRSMYLHSDAAPHRDYVTDFIAGKARQMTSANGKATAYKVLNDARVTPLGRLLRKTSLDELPQLINVLRGDLSLVGARPPIPYELACYRTWHLRRIAEVKPGITGLWQVCGRSKTSFDEMVRLDLRYATSWSLWLDFMILLKTPGAVVSGNGAH
jgi:lipopolysaccharide/colanic/teichoic acid biosynthesis glycosyltransferase